MMIENVCMYNTHNRNMRCTKEIKSHIMFIFINPPHKLTCHIFHQLSNSAYTLIINTFCAIIMSQKCFTSRLRCDFIESHFMPCRSDVIELTDCFECKLYSLCIKNICNTVFTHVRNYIRCQSPLFLFNRS